MKVCCIVGEGRSGSTVLARILGQLPGFLDLGEVSGVARALHTPGWRCGCGRLFVDCPFWQAVFGPDVAPDERFRVNGKGQFQSANSARLRQVHRLWRASHGKESKAAPYGRAISAIYDAVSENEPGAVLVDASKSPSHTLVVKGLHNVDLYVVHLVRDPRAVAYSCARQRPHAGGIADESMVRVGWARAALRWNKNNHMSAFLVRTAVGQERFLRIDYGEFAFEPQKVVKRICRFLGEEPARWPFTSERTVHLEPTHNASGNPGRFRSGEVQISPDSEWQTAMPIMQRIGVAVLAGPLLWIRNAKFKRQK